MRVLLAFGTRPEIIKLGPVVQALKRIPGVELNVFWTGQHIELANGLLDLFDIPVTQTGNDVMEQTGLAGKFGLMAQQIESVLEKNRFDWLIVQGDTATAAAAATAAFLNHVPVAHVEAVDCGTGDSLFALARGASMRNSLPTPTVGAPAQLRAECASRWRRRPADRGGDCTHRGSRSPLVLC